MKLFQLSLTLGLLSNIVLGALTRSWSPLVGMSPGIQKLGHDSSVDTTSGDRECAWRDE